ncbi:aldo/keto reductase [Gryllotalpicola protaetiae]|uniref:Aldo/keto reductase n=1 Tax=Gryllotalpicola protaetiae TaxID=2419771 RepID=A0A387BQZ4_9MICO|nr:aldo/keto reductase [Gryllotalpicola protaetiae]AYG03460.1 aldo/keto reductase [Gryllotalpicola protaetiae]
MTTNQITVTLNNGLAIPALGFGVFQASPEDTVTSVTTALQGGYRLIDTAASYGNEREVGVGIRRSGIDRSEIVIESKLWISDYADDKPEVGFEASLRRLGVDYVDLYLLHQPTPADFDDTIAAYQLLERKLAEGKVHAIGVANFSPDHLTRLLDTVDTVPAVNQVEVHPYFTNATVQHADTTLGILTQAWSPIGGIHRYRPSDGAGAGNVFENPVITGLAAKYGKSPAQVILRWHLDEGRSALPKSTHANRIAENFDVFDFTLTSDELAAIDALDTGLRGGPDPELLNTRTFPRAVDNS